MPCKLLFDLSATQPLSHGAHGAGEYGKSVFRALSLTKPRDVAAYWIAGSSLDRNVLDLAAASGIRTYPLQSPGELQGLLEKLRPVRFYSALPYHLAHINFGSAEFVGTIHGLRPIEMATDDFASRYSRSAREWIKARIRHFACNPYARWRTSQFKSLLRVRAATRRFVVPSHYTKHSLLLRFGSLAETDLVVLYSPATEVTELSSASRELPAAIAPHIRRFLLVVSGDRWVKNSYRVFAAIERLYRHLPRNLQWPVVVTGAMPPLFPARWKSRFMFLGRCPSAQLAGLYANAGALLYPSLNEGFGYPPIEAMSYGTPVLAGAMTAVPEITAEGATYFCPFSIEDICIRLGSFLSDPGLQTALSAAAMSRYRIVRERQQADLNALCSLLLA